MTSIGNIMVSVIYKGGVEMKEEWNKPELVVLVRRMSDEVLGKLCKSSGSDANGSRDFRCEDGSGNGCIDSKKF